MNGSLAAYNAYRQSYNRGWYNRGYSGQRFEGRRDRDDLRGRYRDHDRNWR